MARPIQPVEDYTNTCLVMGLVNLLWVFMVIWAVWGLVPVFVLALVLNAGIKRLETAKVGSG